MKYNLSVRRHIAAAALAMGLAIPCAADQGPSGVLVHLLTGADINAIASSHGATVLESIPDKNLYRLQSSSGGDTGLIQRLTGAAGVDYVEADSPISSAEVVGDPFHFSFDITANPGTFLQASTYAQINLGQAQTQARGFGVIVAVLDTGVAAAHPALQNNLLAGLNTAQTGAAPADLPDGATNTDVGHGTMIAGLISHLAPNAAILPVRVMNADGKGSLFAVAQGIHFAVTQGAKVISMSFNATSTSHVLRDALDEADAAGVVLVAAAGNTNANQAQLVALGHGALIVASVESDSTKSAYSNYGSFVRVSAPGSGVRSAFWNNQYATWSGTSFAAPMVAAEAALILSANPALLSGEVVSIIRNTARSVDNKNPTFRGQLGSGVIDIEAALRKAAGSGTVPANATFSGAIALDSLADTAPAQNVTLTFRPTDGGASFDRIVPSGVNTAFSFSDIPARAYTVHFQAGKYLAVNVPINATFANVSGLSVTLPAGDANSDNSVDATDFGLFVSAYNSSASVPGSGYDPACDFNLDGSVDPTDFGLLVGSYGQQGDN